MQGDKVMCTANKTINIIKDGTVMSDSTFTIHITYNESLTVKELSQVLDFTNKAINDINRENGMKNNVKLGKEYAAEVVGVDSGSIVMHILTYFVSPVALSILANFLYDRLKNIGAKKEKGAILNDSGYPISISVNGENNLIELNITKQN